MDGREIFSAYVVFLRAMALIHQNNHWIDAGANFYAHHLLFKRLYEETADSVDAAAEKCVGVFSSDGLTLARQSKLMSELMNKYSASADGTLESSLSVEKDFSALAKKVYGILKENDQLSLGLDDLIMSQCSVSESHQYLLQQAMKS
jgi:DNA-binding ferritin-like protein